MVPKFQKTSLQLSPSVLRDMDGWTGLSRSEALRLFIERGHYLATLNSERIANLAEEYAPILMEALQELDYGDYRLAVRSLPAIVAGFLCEENRSWRCEDGDHHELDPGELVEKLSALNPVERIGILDCVVAGRYRRSPARPNSAMSTSIRLSFGGATATFEVSRLVEHLEASGRDYIIQGQVNCALSDHPKPNSLDYWLRQNFAANRDAKQAVNEVIDQLVSTGLFQEGDFSCPDSGRVCKGIKLTPAENAFVARS